MVWIGFVILIILIILGVPIAYSFGAATIWMVFSLGYSPDFLMPAAYAKLNGVVLLAIPLFILAGGLMEKGNIGDALVGFIERFVGHIRGSLCVVSTITCAVFGSICGSGAATLSCIGTILAPKMREKKYNMGVAAAIICCSAPLGMLIPPSSIQILYGWTGQLSVLACFLSTVIPGIILTALISVAGWFMIRNTPGMEVSEPDAPGTSWIGNTGRATKHAIPALLMPIIILGGIYSGIMTPSEAAGISCVYAIPVGFLIYKGLTWKSFKNTLVDTATSTGSIMVMLAIIMVMSRILVMENVPDQILSLLMMISTNKYVILLMINIFLVIIGMIMDDVSGTLLCTPILIPIAIKLGVSPYQMAAILGVNLGMGNITPPTAPFLYLSGKICGSNAKEMIKPCLTIILFAYVPVLILTTYVPSLSLWLPQHILGIG